MLRVPALWSREKSCGSPAYATLFLVFYAIVPNVPMWLAVSALDFEHHGIFALEYFMAGALALYIPGFIASVILFSVICADVLLGLCQSYVLSPLECLHEATSLWDLSANRIFAVTVVAVLALLISATAAMLPSIKTGRRNRFILAVCFAGIAPVLFALDLATIVRNTGHLPSFRLATPRDSVRLSSFYELRLARFPTLGLVRVSRNYAQDFDFSDARTHFANRYVPSAADYAFHLVDPAVLSRSGEAANVVLVVVESWGLAADPAFRSALIQPYLVPNVLSKYELVQGTVPFYGSTVAGEARELCDSNMGFHLLTASARELQECLPDRLVSEGFYDVAVHGNSGHMFDRADWYSALGFQERWFREQLRQQGLPSCVGAATGICDAAIADWIGNRLTTRTPKPLFIDWLTLNSHLPVPTPVPIHAVVPCSLLPLPSSEPALCSWTQLILNVHQSVSRLALGHLARPTLFIVVGDHAPPFGDLTIRRQFSASVVPFIVLVPRAIGRSGLQAQR